jgi:hypothetical protein
MNGCLAQDPERGNGAMFSTVEFRVSRRPRQEVHPAAALSCRGDQLDAPHRSPNAKGSVELREIESAGARMHSAQARACIGVGTVHVRCSIPRIARQTDFVGKTARDEASG